MPGEAEERSVGANRAERRDQAAQSAAGRGVLMDLEARTESLAGLNSWMGRLR